jgi:hypothetical protein
LPDSILPAVECGLYAALLGLCAGEAGGLTGRPDADALNEIEATAGLSTMPRLLPALRKLDAGDVFETSIAIIIDGIAALAHKTTAECRPQRGKD